MTFRSKVLALAGVVTLGIGISIAPAFAPMTVAPTSVVAESAMSTCKPPNGPYKRCYNERWWKKTTKPALDWSDSHTARKERRPVPYPAESSRKIYQSNHTVYVILYAPKGTYGPGLTPCKYGITKQKPFEKRANDSLKDCKKATKGGHSYRIDWIAVTDNERGFWTARYIEASLIKQYQRKQGVCPVAQRKSCR